MSRLQRRQFLGLTGRTLLASLMVSATGLGLAACAELEPRPFIVGKAVAAPLGCQQLLARDPRGDC